MAEFHLNKAILLFWVPEFNSDNAKFIVQSDKDLAGHATRVSWKQVGLSDFVFSQKLKLLRDDVYPRSGLNSTHN